ncbi:MAG: NAD(P)-dependent oxidoreductase, partial [Caulobacteraceae bacterium]
MQILVSETAHARIAGRLAALGPDLDVVTVDAAGVLKRGGQAIEGAGVDPEVFWVSLDVLQARMLPAFFEHILNGTKGRYAQVFAAGLDNFGFKSLMQKGLRLAKSTAQAPAIAEFVLAHAFSLLLPMAEQRRAQEAHQWKRVGFREVASTRWLLVGFGAIGRGIAARLQPFGAHLTVVRNHPAPDPLADEVRPASDLINLLPDADVVVLACPLTEETRGMAGTAFFAAMKPG